MVFGVGVGLGVLDARMLRIAAVLAMADAVARRIDAVYVSWCGTDLVRAPTPHCVGV